MITWIDELPDKCPPNEAFDPNGKVFYRLAKTNSVTESDFLSQRKLNPDRTFKDVDECTARSLSIWGSLEKCMDLLKLPRHKNKPRIAMKLKLESKDGLVLCTFKEDHYSWWRTEGFELSTVEVIVW